MGKGGGGSVAETSQEKAAAEIALNRYNRYKEVYRPLEDKVFSRLTSDAESDSSVRRFAGTVAADNAAMLDRSAPALNAIDPSSAQAVNSIANQQRAATVARAAGEAAGIGDKRKIAGLQAAVNIGTGQANEAETSYDSLANSALQENITNQESAFNSSAQRANAIGSGIGALGAIGANAYKGMSGAVTQTGSGGIPNTWSPIGRK